MPENGVPVNFPFPALGGADEGFEKNPGSTVYDQSTTAAGDFSDDSPFFGFSGHIGMAPSATVLCSQFGMHSVLRIDNTFWAKSARAGWIKRLGLECVFRQDADDGEYLSINGGLGMRVESVLPNPIHLVRSEASVESRRTYEFDTTIAGSTIPVEEPARPSDATTDTSEGLCVGWIRDLSSAVLAPPIDVLARMTVSAGVKAGASFSHSYSHKTFFPVISSVGEGSFRSRVYYSAGNSPLEEASLAMSSILRIPSFRTSLRFYTRLWLVVGACFWSRESKSDWVEMNISWK